VKLCRTSDVLPEELKQFNVKGVEILVISRSNQLICLDARCTHAGAPLAEGKLDGDLLTCPWHGSQFNVTNGAVIRGPAKEPLKVYSTSVEEGFLFVDL
jgi:nitrite reductase/ring-hydroxylating ferredoxin subunit